MERHPQGTIIDEDIVRLAQSGQLVIEGFDKQNVKQACYELRASDIFYDVQSTSEDKRVAVKKGEGYLLSPHCHAVCITIEKLRLPPNVLGRILTKGRLFSVGILPVNTYADPGFEGKLGITLYNASHRYIIIRPEEPIAKIEFAVLPKPVGRPYSGQHGYETAISPVATHLYAEGADSNAASAIRSDDEELARSYGPRIAEMSRQLRFYQYGVWAQLLVIFTGFVIVFWAYDRLSLIGSVSIGIISNLLTHVMMALVAKWRSRR